MFKQEETICVSHNKYGYHSIPIEMAMGEEVTLVPPNPKHDILHVHSDELKLVALNPIHGFRNDLGCTAFRNFLVEMDCGPLKEQLNYIKSLEMPYSAVIFSGGKSLHFLISLDQDLPSEKVYRTFTLWIRAIATLADQNCINPSRSIRIPGTEREPGKRQILVEMPGKVKINDFTTWLSKYMHLKPQERQKREVSGKYDFSRLNKWTVDKLIRGFDPNKGRNKQWFSIACEFAIAGYSEEDTIDILRDYYTEEHDFKEREWLTAVRSGFKYIYDRK